MLQRPATSLRGADHATSQMPGASRVLSARQREVLELLADGVPARRIATTLGIAEATVRNHIRQILHKLECHSQLEAVAVAFRLNLLRRDEPDDNGR